MEEKDLLEEKDLNEMEEQELNEMEEQDLDVLARRENNNTAMWFIAGIVFLVTAIIGIALFFSRTPRNWGHIVLFIMSMPIALFSLIYAFRDAGKPDALIILEEDKESINAYCKSKWVNIRISDIKDVIYGNYSSRGKAFKSGWLTIQTTDGYHSIRNVQNVAEVCYDIKTLAKIKDK